MFKWLTIFFMACTALLFICQILYWRIKKGVYEEHYSYTKISYWLPAMAICSLGLVSLIIGAIQGQFQWWLIVILANLFIGFVAFYLLELDEAPPAGCQCVRMAMDIRYNPKYATIPFWLPGLVWIALLRLVY